MENILLARVDDRLIHGQVMTAWLKRYPAKQIIIIDDGVAKDDFMASVLQMAAPSGVKVRVFSCEKAIQAMGKGIKNPTIDGGLDLTAINIGGMGINETRKTFHKNIAASEEEKEAMRNLLDRGVDVKIQVIPQDKVVEVRSLL